jgi:Tripartite tricarboxylate transporter TctB family
MRADRALGIVLALLALLFLVFAIDTIPKDWQTQTGAQYFVVGPELFPRIAGVLCLVLALLLALRPDGQGALHELKANGAVRNVLMLLAISGAYVALIGTLGFRIATGLMLAAFLLAFGVRRPLVVAGVAIAVPLLVGLAFQHLFGIFLPALAFAIPGF